MRCAAAKPAPRLPVRIAQRLGRRCTVIPKRRTAAPLGAEGRTSLPESGGCFCAEVGCEIKRVAK